MARSFGLKWMLKKNRAGLWAASSCTPGVVLDGRWRPWAARAGLAERRNGSPAAGAHARGPSSAVSHRRDSEWPPDLRPRGLNGGGGCPALASDLLFSEQPGWGGLAHWEAWSQIAQRKRKRKRLRGPGQQATIRRRRRKGGGGGVVVGLPLSSTCTLKSKCGGLFRGA